MLLLVLLLLFTHNPACSTNGGGQFVYNGFAGANLTIDGTAFVTSDGLLVLNNDTQNSKGHAMYPSLLHFHNKSPNNTSVLSFSTTFVFAILSPYTNLSDYGFVLFIAPTKNFSSALANEYMGLFTVQNNGNTNNHIFAIELDTLRNFYLADIDSNHVGININGLKSVNSASAGYYDDTEKGSFRNLTLMNGKIMQLWVDYDARRAVVNVTLAPAQVPKPKRPLLSYHVNLSTVITEPAYFGFASSLDRVLTRHCILGWSFALNSPAVPLDYTKLPRLPKAHHTHNSLHAILKIVVPIACMMLILTVVGTAFALGWRRIKYAELHEDWEDEFGPHRFLYKDLFHATNGFSDNHMLGVGGFGKVYKGILPVSKVEIAVKKVSHDSQQGIKEFIAEITSIGRLEHKNLVRLLGYCRRKHELLLVYEYLSNGSLDKYLYCRELNQMLDWDTRFRIIKGVALGLFYLHDNCEKVVIHRDIKASNVLLDDEMNGRLGDFGLAKLYNHGTDPETTHVVGTIGYLAPELARTSKATPSTDVFAFGMFLLEVACGRRPILLDAQENHVWLVDWVIEHWAEGSITRSVDRSLEENYSVDEASLVLKVGLLCSRPLPSARPVMRRVVQYLAGAMPLPEMSPTSPNFGTLALLQNDGFELYAMPNAAWPASVMSYTVESDLSGGR